MPSRHIYTPNPEYYAYPRYYRWADVPEGRRLERRPLSPEEPRCAGAVPEQAQVQHTNYYRCRRAATSDGYCEQHYTLISTTAEMSNTTPLVSARRTPANLGKEAHASSNTNAHSNTGRAANGHGYLRSLPPFPRPGTPSAHRPVETTGPRVRTADAATVPAAHAHD